MYDIVFVDVPFVHTDINCELANEMKLYENECEKITNRITGKAVVFKKLYYTSGILCLSSYLKHNIPNIRIGYIHYEINLQELSEYAKNTSAMAFSTMTYSINSILELAKTAKRANPQIRILFGGYHASYFPEQLLKQHQFIDCIFIKEGEKSLFKYISGVPLEHIDGIAYRDKNGEVCMKPKCDILDANEIPIPDYSLIEDYIHLFNISISTMRGCIGKCKFCVNSNYWSLPRIIPTDKIITELKYLKTVIEKGSIIHINDNVFTYQEKRLHELYAMMEKNDLLGYFVFECDTLSSLLTISTIKLLQKIGVIKICIGIEDCCNEILRISNKPVTHEENIEAAKMIKSVAPSICVYAYWLIGLPGSTVETIKYNISEMSRLISEGFVDIISPKVFIPYPGTVFFEEYGKYGITKIVYNWEQYERRNPPYPYKYKGLTEYELFNYLINAFRTCNHAYGVVHKKRYL